jgi:TRAP-type C4-dicarboxylate transport system substrate-binding protein
MLSRLGASGIPMPPDEVLPAIQQRTIDGNKAGITIFVPFKYYDVVKNLWMPGDSQLCVLKFASVQWMAKLPADLRTAVIEESLKASEEVMPFTLKLDNDMYEAWKKNGGIITEFAPDEQKRFMDRIADVGDVVYKDKPQPKALLDLLKKVAKRHEKM